MTVITVQGVISLVIIVFNLMISKFTRKNRVTAPSNRSQHTIQIIYNQIGVAPYLNASGMISSGSMKVIERQMQYDLTFPYALIAVLSPIIGCSNNSLNICN